MESSLEAYMNGNTVMYKPEGYAKDVSDHNTAHVHAWAGCLCMYVSAKGIFACA